MIVKSVPYAAYFLLCLVFKSGCWELCTVWTSGGVDGWRATGTATNKTSGSSGCTVCVQAVKRLGWGGSVAHCVCLSLTCLFLCWRCYAQVVVLWQLQGIAQTPCAMLISTLKGEAKHNSMSLRIRKMALFQILWWWWGGGGGDYHSEVHGLIGFRAVTKPLTVCFN